MSNALVIPNEALEQGSLEWLERRATWVCGATTAGVIMGDPNYYPDSLKSWREVREFKNKEVVQRQIDSPALAHGKKYEEVARAYFDPEGTMEQVCIELDLRGGLGVAGASLDGYDAEKKRALEIKCPFTQAQSPYYRAVLNQSLPNHMKWQIIHQMYVSDGLIDEIAFCVYLSDHPQLSDWLLYTRDDFAEDLDRLDEELHRFAAGETQFPDGNFDFLSEKWMAEDDAAKELEEKAKALREKANKTKIRLVEHEDVRGKFLRVTSVAGRKGYDMKAIKDRFGEKEIDKFQTQGKGSHRIYRL